VQIGSDGGLLGAPIEHSSLVVAQAERFDVVVDFSAYQVGAEVSLVNRLGDGSTAQVKRFKIARKASDDSSIPARLSSCAEAPEPAGVVRRKWRFSRRSAGGRREGLSNRRDPVH
jgi:hypothetical protein